MEPFRTFTGLVAPLNRAHVDTDQVIPKQFLKSITRTGLGKGLFFDWRLMEDGTENPNFSLNQPRYRGASILLARQNFGCGSSREHAPLGLDGLRLPGPRRALVRRYLLQQLLQERHAAGRA